MEHPLVYIIVLNYNGKFHLEYCLPSILETDYPNYKVLLVDNDSSDDSLDFVRANFPSIEILETGANLGWAGGNNRGIERAHADGAKYVVLANNDIKVHRAWLTAAVQAFESDEAVGFVGGTVFGDIKPTAIENYEHACENWKQIDFEYTDDYIDGMALFVRRTVFDEIGDIDEAFFVYSEETDLEIRGKLAGLKRMKTNVPIWHYSSGTFSKMKIRGAFLAMRNTIRISIKHDSTIGVIKTLVTVLNIACSPFFKGDLELVYFARLRPRNIFFNFGLFCICLAWNVWHLPATIRRARADYRLIAQAKSS